MQAHNGGHEIGSRSDVEELVPGCLFCFSPIRLLLTAAATQPMRHLVTIYDLADPQTYVQVSPDSTGKSIFRKSPHPSKIPFEPPVNPQPLDAECNSNFSMVFSTHGEETSPQSCASITPLQEKFTQMRTRQPARRLLVFDQNQSHQQWDSASSEASLNRDRSASPIWGQTATCGSDDGVSKGETHSSPPLSPSRCWQVQ